MCANKSRSWLTTIAGMDEVRSMEMSWSLASESRLFVGSSSSTKSGRCANTAPKATDTASPPDKVPMVRRIRSEEHTSELQSRFDLVCRLLLEKKKQKVIQIDILLITYAEGHG